MSGANRHASCLPFRTEQRGGNMATHAMGTFEQKTWDEKPYNETEGEPKLTRVSATKSFHGDIEGEGSVEYLMVYPDGNSAYYTGLERVVGSIEGRSGSFVLQLDGTFEGGIAQTTWSVVPGSGVGDLSGLQGNGGFVAQHGESVVPYTLEYEFGEPG